MQSSPKKQKAKKAAAPKGKRPKSTYKQPQTNNRTNEPAIEYTAKLRAIGNSRGVILNTQLLDTAGLITDQNIVIRAVDGLITIKQAEKPVANTDLSTWDKQFKAVIKGGARPERDLFEGIENNFDATEW